MTSGDVVRVYHNAAFPNGQGGLAMLLAPIADQGPPGFEPWRVHLLSEPPGIDHQLYVSVSALVTPTRADFAPCAKPPGFVSP